MFRFRIVLRDAFRGEGSRGPISAASALNASDPLMRSTATPAGSRPLESAYIVLSRCAIWFSLPLKELAASVFQTRPYHSLLQDRPMNQVFIDSKKSPFVFVCFSLSIRNSMASVVPIGARIRRRTKIFWRSWRGTSRSSLRVPDLRISMDGKMRLSATLRSRTISELPVP